MKFFMPGLKPTAAEADYEAVTELLKKQLRWNIIPHRIRKLNYIHDKKKCVAEVGQLENQNHEFVIIAIFESASYIVYTRAHNGTPGVIILVSKDEVTDIEDFDAPVVPEAVIAA